MNLCEDYNGGRGFIDFGMNFCEGYDLERVLGMNLCKGNNRGRGFINFGMKSC